MIPALEQRPILKNNIQRSRLTKLSAAQSLASLHPNLDKLTKRSKHYMIAPTPRDESVSNSKKLSKMNSYRHEFKSQNDLSSVRKRSIEELGPICYLKNKNLKKMSNLAKMV